MRARGFTIVELLIVIVVIGIIATIVAVSYSGITESARLTSLKSDLQAANTSLGGVMAYSKGVWQPQTFPESVQVSDGNYIELTAPTAAGVSGHCVNGIRTNPTAVYSWHSEYGFSEGLCPYLPTGDSRGTAPNPLIPRGVNVAPSLREWSPRPGSNTANVTYDVAKQEFVVNQVNSSETIWWSPPIRVDGARTLSVRMTVWPTAASTTFTPQGGIYGGTYYFAADCVTPVYNPYYQPANNYHSNGFARGAAVNTWTDIEAGFYLDIASGATNTVQCFRVGVISYQNSIYTQGLLRIKKVEVLVFD